MNYMNMTEINNMNFYKYLKKWQWKMLKYCWNEHKSFQFEIDENLSKVVIAWSSRWKRTGSSGKCAKILTSGAICCVCIKRYFFWRRKTPNKIWCQPESELDSNWHHWYFYVRISLRTVYLLHISTQWPLRVRQSKPAWKNHFFA